jgi:cytoskeletal protein CcmA (bactofilin family)
MAGQSAPEPARTPPLPLTTGPPSALICKTQINGNAMFNKTADPTSAPSPAMPASNTKSVFSSDLRISGEISSTGDIEMAGEIDGNINARQVTIGVEGRVNGALKADAVDVKGQLDGTVDAGSFTLRSTAHVSADVSYATLVIESGAQIDGRFARHK